MASSVVMPAAKLIGNSLVDEVKYLYAVKNKVESLHDELIWMGCFLKDVDANQHDEMINLWVSRITDLAGDAEDIVENYLHKVSRHRRDGIWSTLKWFSCICCDAVSLHQVGSDIDRLKDRIAELSSRMHTYGVKTQSLAGGGTSSKSRRLCEKIERSLYDIEEDGVVGMGGDAEALVRDLTADSGPGVVCIAGKDKGSGKTTLAQLVYKDKRVDAYFSSKAWVYVSQQCEPRSVMEGIFEKLDGGYYRTIAGGLVNEVLVFLIRQALTERKCLVVLDGVFFERDWAALAPAFATVTGSQSRLLLTTRNNKLLLNVGCQGLTVEIKEDLNHRESHELLRNGLFPHDYETEAKIRRLGEAILNDCYYKPSSIALLRAILSTKTRPAEFEEVRENLRVYRDYLLDGESSVLELSYYDLPYYLKPCFLHLGNFPENIEIPIEKICRLWAIEGIVAQPTESVARQAPVEAIAEAYLAELASRNLVQLGGAGRNGMTASCRLHSIVRDMCRRKSKEENFLDVIEHREFQVQARPSSAPPKNQKLRRLAIYVHRDGNNLRQVLSDRNTTAQHVRTLMLFPTEGVPFSWIQGTMSEFLKLVRILDFEGVCISSVPSEIGELIHLRYLNLKGTDVRSLPSSIGKLKFIQFLDLRVHELIQLIIPNVIWKLERLRNLFLPNKWKVRVSRSLMSSISITRTAAEKTKLRLRGLTQLETLENLSLKDCMVKDVQKLEKLYQVSFEDDVVTETHGLRSFLSSMEAASQHKKTIPVIRVDGSVLNEDPTILTSHPRQLFIDTLELYGGLTIRLDLATTFPEYLQVLVLMGCELEDDPMPILEKLPVLRELTLGTCSYAGTEMVCTAGNFRGLFILRLIRLECLREWKVEETAMEGLRKLLIHSCDQLTKIPDGLPEQMRVSCSPCIPGGEMYGCCLTTTSQ